VELAWRRAVPAVAPRAWEECEAAEPQRARTRRASPRAALGAVPRDGAVALLPAGPWVAGEPRVSVAAEPRLGAAAPQTAGPAWLAARVEAEPPLGECRKSRKTCSRRGKTCDSLGTSPARQPAPPGGAEPRLRPLGLQALQSRGPELQVKAPLPPGHATVFRSARTTAQSSGSCSRKTRIACTAQFLAHYRQRSCLIPVSFLIGVIYSPVALIQMGLV
jgi:hypothetical protein